MRRFVLLWLSLLFVTFPAFAVINATQPPAYDYGWSEASSLPGGGGASSCWDNRPIGTTYLYTATASVYQLAQKIHMNDRSAWDAKGWMLLTSCTSTMGHVRLMLSPQYPKTKTTELVCPANSTLTGTTCTCNAEFQESAGSCVAIPPPSCPAGASGGGYYFTVPPGGTMPQYAQQEGSRCVTQYVNDVCTLGPDGTRYCHAQTKLTGDYCPSTGCTGDGSAPGSPSPTPPEDVKSDTSGPCQPGYYYGTVNGQTVCVPGQGSSSSDTKDITKTNPDGTASDKKTTTVTSTGTTENGTKQTQTTQTTLETQWEAAQKITYSGPPSVPATVQIPTTAGETKTTTVTNPDGSVTKYDVKKNADGTTDVTTTEGKVVEKTDSTTCTGTKCTTDQTTKENGTTTSTTKGETTLDGLCKESPDHAACGTDKESAFGGTCSAGFNCDGDAIQCAMARKQHETVCALFENKSPESDLYDAEKAKTGNVTDANPNNSTQSIGSGMFDFTSALGGGSCIPNKSVTVWGKSIDLPFSDICPWLNALGTVLVSVSSLVALRIVMRG